MSNLAASVHQRLLNYARANKRVFNDVLQHYALERFLYRLGQSPLREQFILKGALMLAVWSAESSRPTRDIDLLGRTANTPAHIVDRVGEICSTPCEPDGMVFDASTISAERSIEGASYAGVRVRFRARLGKAQIPMQVDIGFGDALVPGPFPVIYPGTLAVPQADILGYSMESAIAEKLQVMAVLGELNSRLKDYYDVWLLSETSTVCGLLLGEALRATFDRRGTSLTWPEESFAPRYVHRHVSDWAALMRRSGRQDAPSLQVATTRISQFLRPVVDGLVENRALADTWRPGGPWR